MSYLPTRQYKWGYWKWKHNTFCFWTSALVSERIWVYMYSILILCVFSAPEPKCTIMITRCRPSVVFYFHIFDFFSETAEWNSTKLDRKQDLNALYQVCVFRADRKNKMAPLPLIGWDIFDFSSKTAEQNSTKLDRKQDLNVLYQVCVFRADQKNKMAALSSDWLRHFWLLLWNRWTELNETWEEARSQRPLPKLCF